MSLHMLGAVNAIDFDEEAGDDPAAETKPDLLFPRQGFPSFRAGPIEIDPQDTRYDISRHYPDLYDLEHRPWGANFPEDAALDWAHISLADVEALPAGTAVGVLGAAAADAERARHHLRTARHHVEAALAMPAGSASRRERCRDAVREARQAVDCDLSVATEAADVEANAYKVASEGAALDGEGVGGPADTLPGVATFPAGALGHGGGGGGGGHHGGGHHHGGHFHGGYSGPGWGLPVPWYGYGGYGYPYPNYEIVDADDSLLDDDVDAIAELVAEKVAEKAKGEGKNKGKNKKGKSETAVGAVGGSSRWRTALWVALGLAGVGALGYFGLPVAVAAARRLRG